jgi:hypothetical protein
VHLQPGGLSTARCNRLSGAVILSVPGLLPSAVWMTALWPIGDTTGATSIVWSKIAMPWAQRGWHKYYYRSVREGRHVRKEYLGTGPLAALYATEDAERRAQH